MSPYESRLVDSVGSLAVVSLTLLTPTMLLPSSSGLIKFCLIACLRASASVAGWNLSDGDYARQLAFLKLRPTSLEVPVPILYQDNTPTDVATSQSDQGNGLNKKEWSMGGPWLSETPPDAVLSWDGYSVMATRTPFQGWNRILETQLGSERTRQSRRKQVGQGRPET